MELLLKKKKKNIKYLSFKELITKKYISKILFYL